VEVHSRRADHQVDASDVGAGMLGVSEKERLELELA